MLTRRDFVKQATLISLAPTVPTFLAQTARGAAPSPDDRILVVIQLDGGNDGLNTVVPYADANYARLRPKLAVEKKRVSPLGRRRGAQSCHARRIRAVSRRPPGDRARGRLPQSEQVARREQVDLGNGPL